MSKKMSRLKSLSGMAHFGFEWHLFFLRFNSTLQMQYKQLKKSL